MLELQLKENGQLKRLTNKTFKFDNRYGEGYFSASYFIKTEKIISEYHPDNIVTIQWFTRKDSMVCGLDEAIALLHTFARNPEQLKITALNDGDLITSMEPVLKVTGRYQDFGYLEGPIDGILARRTSVATNCYEIVKAAGGKSLMFFGDRDDDPRNHPGDGYAAYVGGIKTICTDAMGEWTGLKGAGTMPHALIVMFKKDLLKAAEAFHKVYKDNNLIILIDSNNDVVTDGVLVADKFKGDLFGVRIDTSASMEDEYFKRVKDLPEGTETHGVNVTLVKALREALDAKGHQHVKIVVSSGFNTEKVKMFTEENTPVDIYGVGGSLTKLTRSFTGDVVNVDNEPIAKVGRAEIFSDRLVEVKFGK